MNPLLEKTKNATLDAINPPQLRPVVDKLVSAGEKIMYAPETRDMMIKQLSGDGEPAENVGGGIAKLIGIIYQQSKHTAPMQALIPAATLLMCEGLQFLEDAGEVPIDLPFFEDCTQAMASNVLQLFGVTPEKLQGIIGGQGAEAPPPEPAGPGPQPAPAPTGIIGSAMGGV